MDFGAKERVTDVIATGSTAGAFINEFVNIFVAVGNDAADPKGNTACLGSPFFPADPGIGKGFDTTCDLEGQYFYLYQDRYYWLSVTMIAVFLECSCTGMAFTADLPAYADLNASVLGPPVT